MVSSLTNEERAAAVEAVRQSLAPDVPFQTYARQVGAFHEACLNRLSKTFLPQRPLSEADAPQSNAGQFEAVSYEYSGEENLAVLREQGRTPCFLLWHHGARDHLLYALARRFPDLAIFTRQCAQFGSLFTHPTAGEGAVALLKMRALLETRTPFAHYLDGAPLGETVRTQMLNYPSRISTSPLALFVARPWVALAPVSSRYHSPTKVQVHFHGALSGEGRSADGDNPVDRSPAAVTPSELTHVIDTALRTLTQWQRENAPFQVIPRYLPHRERRRD